MNRRRATEGTAGVLVQYVEEPEGAQRRWHARIRRRRKLVRNTGYGCADLTGWYDLDGVGIDAGITVLRAKDARSQFVWRPLHEE